MTQIVCRSCVMDLSDPDIIFDNNGVCNHCHQAQQSLKEIEAEKHKLPEILKQIKKHNCICGLSGGVDSSYILHKAVELGLKPICFSLDNGWNTDIANTNIKKLVKKLKLKHFVYKIDLKKYKELQSAFIKAGVKNIEIPFDHILMAVTYEMAVKYKCKWILSGGNVSTESILPNSWGANARDLVHIKDIYRKMTGKKLRGLPVCSLLKWNYYRWVKRIKTLYLLDYL